ncbi:MAG: glycosylase [Planctomycetaceae bacterium]
MALLVLVAFVAALPCRADEAADFPTELVDFGPASSVPLFSGGGDGAWDQNIRERGWIRREGPDRWRLWYTGYDDERSPLRLLGHATSTDGLNWSRDPSGPLVPGEWVEDVCVVRDTARLVMFAEGTDDIPHLLVSTDGLAWEERGPLDIRMASGEPIPPGPRGTPTAWHEEGVWWLFYERGDQGVWVARSRDLVTFTNVTDEPVLALGPARYDARMIAMDQIVKHRGRYYAYYHASAPGEKRRWCTCIARSDDLVHWTKYARNPIVPVDEAHPATSSAILVPDGERHRLYTTHPEVRVRFSVLPVHGATPGSAAAARP